MKAVAMRHFLVGVMLGCLGLFWAHALCNGQEVRCPTPPNPLDIPVTNATRTLGWFLFHDTRVSSNNTISCQSCHKMSDGFGDHLPLAVGINGSVGTRNSPPVLNKVFDKLMFHDMRTVGPATQTLQPIVNPIEMGQQTQQQVIDRLNRIQGYRDLAQLAYGEPRLRALTFAHAITSFESMLVGIDCPVNRRIYNNNPKALSPEAEIGFGLMQKASCFECHKPPFFTDPMAHNNGFEFATRGIPSDPGRFTQDPSRGNLRAFKTASLIQVRDTFPYGHHGGVLTLANVVQHYNSGGAKDGRIDSSMDPRIRPQGWNKFQQACVYKCLEEGFVLYKYPAIRPPRRQDFPR